MICEKCNREIITQPCLFCNPVISREKLHAFWNFDPSIPDGSRGLLNVARAVVSLWELKLISSPIWHALAREAVEEVLAVKGSKK
jgi:hypothetical protein